MKLKVQNEFLKNIRITEQERDDDLFISEIHDIKSDTQFAKLLYSKNNIENVRKFLKKNR